jgi:broad specificity phosphatase PhoE
LKRIFLVRHGESEWNSARRLQGQADIALSETGRVQARELSATILSLAPDQALTSDLKRASETAKLLGFQHAATSSRLREIDVGEWTGQSIKDLSALNDGLYRRWRAGSYTPPGGESWSDFMARSSAAVTEALQHGAERLLVVCHGGVIRALLQHLIDLPPHRLVPVGPASLSIVAVRDLKARDIRLEVLNYRPDGPALDSPD